MANEFRVKNGLIVDEVSAGAGVLTIADSDISSDDGSIAMTVVDGQTVTIGKSGSHANIVVAPHGTASSEKITLTNTSGTAADAIGIVATAGGLTVDVAGDIKLDADGGNVVFADGSTDIFNFDVDGTQLTIHDDQDTGDYFDITIAQHGATTISTVDDDATAADLTLDIDGDITLDAAGGDIKFVATALTLETDNAELRFSDGSYETGFKAHATMTANAMYTLPPAWPNGNKMLQSTSAGALTWENDLSVETLATAGTVSIGADLEVAGGDLEFGKAQNATITVEATDTGTDGKDLTISAGAATAASTNDAGGDLILTSGDGDGTGTSEIIFKTKVTGTDAVAERMRIGPLGYLGIGTTSPDHSLEIESSAASEPVLSIKNTHAGATSGELRFSKDSASGADSDVMGMISFYGTDAGNNTEEKLAYMDAYIVESDHGSEAAGIRFYVAEYDATNTLAMSIVGDASNDGVTTTIIHGNMQVLGTTSEVSSTTISIEDALIELGMVDGAAPSETTTIDLGMIVNYYHSSAKKGAFYWDSSATSWALSEVVAEGGGQVLTPSAGDTEMRYYYDASNYYSIGVAANGATTLQTVDSDGTAGNLQITADGTAELAGTTVSLDSAGDINLYAAGEDINFYGSSDTAYGSITNNSGVMQIKSAANKELEIRSERDMTFLVDDDASDSNSFFTFKTEDNTLADSSNFDNRVGKVITKYYSTSLLIGQTEFGKGLLSSNSEGTLFTYDGTVFGAVEVTIHITDGTTDQINKMMICADTSSGDAVNYSNYSVLYSDGSTELGTVSASISTNTVSVKVDADINDTVTYAVTFLA